MSPPSPASPRRPSPGWSNGRSNVDAADPRPGARGHGRDRLPAQQRRPGAEVGPVPHHRRHHVRACPASATCALSTPSPPRRPQAGYSITLIPVALPTQGAVAGAVQPARRAGRRRHRDHHGGAHPRPDRRDRADRAARRDRRLRRRRPLHGGRHRPGRGRPAGHPAPARPRAHDGLAHRRTRVVVLGRAPHGVLARHPQGGRRAGAARARAATGSRRVRLRARAGAGRRPGGDRDLRLERPDGPRRDAGPARGAAGRCRPT